MKFILGMILGLGLISAAQASDLAKIPLKSIDGQSTSLEAYKGKVILVVNTASRCGYTPQYEGLQKLYDQRKASGLVVLGFPSNDFGRQEPGTNSEIKAFCEGKYHVTFPMFEKGPVTGSAIQPLFKALLDDSPDHVPVDWNFEKFLIGRDGKLITRFRSKVTPDSSALNKSLDLALAKSEK